MFSYSFFCRIALPHFLLNPLNKRDFVDTIKSEGSEHLLWKHSNQSSKRNRFRERRLHSSSGDYVEPFEKALDEIHQFVIYFESRNRDIWKGEFKGEDELQEHLESWRIVHSELNLDDRLNEAGVPILKKLRLVRELFLKNNKQSAMVILTDIPSREMSLFQVILCELKVKVLDSISTFKRDEQYFNMLIDMQNFELSLDEKEIENIDPGRLQ